MSQNVESEKIKCADVEAEEPFSPLEIASESSRMT